MIPNSNLDKNLFGVGVLCHQREHETLQTLLNLKNQNINNVIILQDGSKENHEIKRLSEKIRVIAKQNNWVYLFEGVSKGAAEASWNLLDICSSKFKYFLFNEDDILINENYFKYIEIFLQKKEQGLLHDVVSLSPYAELRSFKNKWTKSKRFHIWGSVIESEFYKNFYRKSISKGLRIWNNPNLRERRLWNEIFLLNRKSNENIYDVQFTIALLSSQKYQLRTPLDEAMHVGYGDKSTHFKDLSEEKLNFEINSWKKTLSKNNVDLFDYMDKAIIDEKSLKDSGISLLSLIINYLRMIIFDIHKTIHYYK